MSIRKGMLIKIYLFYLVFQVVPVQYHRNAILRGFNRVSNL